MFCIRVKLSGVSARSQTLDFPAHSLVTVLTMPSLLFVKFI
jgi:hypothetical protein